MSKEEKLAELFSELFENIGKSKKPPSLGDMYVAMDRQKFALAEYFADEEKGITKYLGIIHMGLQAQHNILAGAYLTLSEEKDVDEVLKELNEAHEGFIKSFRDMVKACK